MKRIHSTEKPVLPYHDALTPYEDEPLNPAKSQHYLDNLAKLRKWAKPVRPITPAGEIIFRISGEMES